MQKYNAKLNIPLAPKGKVTGKSDSSEKPAKPKVRWKAIFSLVALVVLGSASYLALPANVQYALQDAVKRPFAPNFDLPPNQMKSARQDDWITMLLQSVQSNDYSALKESVCGVLVVQTRLKPDMDSIGGVVGEAANDDNYENRRTA